MVQLTLRIVAYRLDIAPFPERMNRSLRAQQTFGSAGVDGYRGSGACVTVIQSQPFKGTCDNGVVPQQGEV
ncbi:unnamed protein product [Boreogadus saida]